MKKLMIVLCVLGLSAVAHAQIMSPVLTSYSALFKKSGDKKIDAKVQDTSFPELAKTAVMAQAEKVAQDAEEELKDLFDTETLHTKVTYESMVKWHRKLISVFKNEKNEEARFYYQNHINDLEIFASEMSALDETVRKNIEAILNHLYYFPNYKEGGLVSLKEAALGFSELSVKTYGGHETAGLNRKDATYFKHMQRAEEVNKQALRIALRAENDLRKLMPGKNNIIVRHQYLVGAMTATGREDFVYQDVEIALENLASAVKNIQDEALAKQVIAVLNHDYYFPRYEYRKLVSLKEIAEDVDSECRILGNGFDSAGLQDGGFYQSL